MTTIRHVRLHLTVRTPVHVGGTHHLSPGMYAVSGSDHGTVTVFSERKLIAWLEQRRLAGAFVAYVERELTLGEVRGRGRAAHKGPVQAFLEQYASRSEPIERLAAYTVPWHGWRYEHRLHRPAGSLRPFLRDGRHQVLIPGSSVRGALRTAIFGSWLLGSSEDLAKVERSTREHVEAQQRQRTGRSYRSDRRHRYPATELEIDFFSRLQWCEEERRKIEPPHRDVLRALKVAD
ncbi:MAG TPA: RAMP superfamily CRISPR-associated protein, partial [Thermaerobacter sp.]